MDRKEHPMNANSQAASKISATINGAVSGQVAVGNHISLVSTTVKPALPDQADLAVLRQMLAGLKERVAAETPPEKQAAALERVAELEEALTAEKPDLSTMEYVQGWFTRHLPGVAGAVVSVIVNPIVGKLVEAAGEALAAEFRRRFGG
jgi:hypothetical protein